MAAGRDGAARSFAPTRFGGPGCLARAPAPDLRRVAGRAEVFFAKVKQQGVSLFRGAF
jgi:hypothetical protein